MKKPITRLAALEILMKLENSGTFISDLLSQASKKHSLNFPLLQRLVKGTLEWRSRLDNELEKAVGKKFSPLGAASKYLLRMAAYQFLYLERVSKPLVISETRIASDTIMNPKERQVLLECLPSLNTIQYSHEPSSEFSSNSAKEIAEHFNHPLWTVEEWIKELGAQETISLCSTNNRPWPVSVRTNTLKISTHQLRKRLIKEGVRFEPGKYSPDNTTIMGLPRNTKLDKLDCFRDGLFQVQDESASLIGFLAEPRPGDFVIDLCSAPGGKASHLAMLMKNRGRILAVDINLQRLSPLMQNCRRLGLRIIKPQEADALKLSVRNKANLVLLDAPCSGLGVLGRKSDIRFTKSPAKIKELTQLQAKLINHASEFVLPGGTLVYSTCTLNRAENQDIVNGFLKTHPEFSVLPPPENLDGSLFTREGYLQTWPQRHQMGGAFGAAMVKDSQQN